MDENEWLADRFEEHRDHLRATLLDPDVVLRIDAGAGRPAASMVIHGPAAVAARARRGLASSRARRSNCAPPW
jgi:hypothetical protein